MTKEFEFEFEGGRACVSLKVYTDKYYGADADGNMSMPTSFVEVQDFKVFNAFDGLVNSPGLIERAFSEFQKNYYEKFSEELMGGL